MMSSEQTGKMLLGGGPFTPAEPLWRLAPTRGENGESLTDFMMLVPGLAGRSPGARRHVATSVREVCVSYGEKVAFADINYSINVLWVSVAAEPGLAGRVAQSIRQRLPDALLVGGQLATGASLAWTDGRPPLWRVLMRRLRRRVSLRLEVLKHR